jgi:hypothetical protein
MVDAVTEDLNPYWAGYPIELQRKWHAAYKALREEGIASSVSAEEAEAEAFRLFDAGWVQKSRKRRLVIDTGQGPGGDPLGMLQRVRPDLIAGILRDAIRYAQTEARAHLWHEDSQTKQLDFLTFERFRALSTTASDIVVSARVAELRRLKEET